MFYPVESLKRGGRFYLCWVADSWPMRFAAITHRQLWSQDIRQLCDDLRVVITNESGQPIKRFSLRLSSQLLRGLVRLYERKATVLLADLCMMSANVFKHANKRHVEHDRRPPRRLPQLPPAETLAQQEPENEPRVEDLLQNSGNVVSNIQDITLKEATIPEFRLPPNDNFGEENPDQALQTLLGDRTIEMMLHEVSGAQVSGLELPLESTDKSRDRSRLGVEAPQMETIAEMDVTLFRKYIPEIPEFPNLPVPTEPILPEPIRQEPQAQQKEKSPEVPVAEVPVEQPRVQEPIEGLEELEGQPMARRRRRRRLIVDTKKQLSSAFLKARTRNPNVEMRYEDFTDAIVNICVPASALLREPTHSGCRLFTGMAAPLCRMFERRCEHLFLQRQNDDLLQETDQPRRTRTQTAVEKIVEIEENPAATEQDLTRRATEGPAQTTETSIVIKELRVSIEPLNITEAINKYKLTMPDLDVLNVEVPRHEDIADLPTQKLETLSQIAKKRTTGQGKDESPPKRVRRGSVSYKERQQQRASQEQPQVPITEPEVQKENMHPNIQEPPARVSQKVASRMLHEVGLSDLQQYPQPHVEPQVQTQGKKEASEGSETPLGSLDRTKVSLGDSAKTTDDQRFVRKQWGSEGTMMKILEGIKADGAVTVQSLVERGPLLPGQTRIIAALCFASILKLKQHGFVRVVKEPDTLEIRDIMLGPRFDLM